MPNIFKRYEKKYVISKRQYDAFMNAVSRHIKPDARHEYTVQNLYYDTQNSDIIRASLESPFYKEKMRLRRYGEGEGEGDCYLELKKKYDGIVYKRRMAIPAEALAKSSVRRAVSRDNSQIAREMDFYMQTNAVAEKVYISYKRTAFTGAAYGEPRVTFDADVRFRLTDLSFSRPNDGTLILPREKLLMEIKAYGAMPLWLTRALSENGIFPTPYSKYGVCYTEHIFKRGGFECLNQFPQAL